MYLLDGQWTFKLLASIYFGLRHGMFVPEMIIVGITYGGESPDYERLRAMDYTPTQAEGMEHTGDGPKFRAFLKKELIPFVEKNSRPRICTTGKAGVDIRHRPLRPTPATPADLRRAPPGTTPPGGRVSR